MSLSALLALIVFRAENERRVAAVEARLERQLAEERQRCEESRAALRRQEERFHTTEEALGAASRLSESLDQKETVVGELRAEGESCCGPLRARSNLIW